MLGFRAKSNLNQFFQISDAHKMKRCQKFRTVVTRDLFESVTTAAVAPSRIKGS
jgi:hypothetical protein